MERPKCEICKVGGGLTFILGKLACGACAKKYRERREAQQKKILDEIRGEANGTQE